MTNEPARWADVAPIPPMNDGRELVKLDSWQAAMLRELHGIHTEMAEDRRENSRRHDQLAEGMGAVEEKPMTHLAIHEAAHEANTKHDTGKALVD